MRTSYRARWNYFSNILALSIAGFVAVLTMIGGVLGVLVALTAGFLLPFIMPFLLLALLALGIWNDIKKLVKRILYGPT